MAANRNEIKALRAELAEILKQSLSKEEKDSAREILEDSIRVLKAEDSNRGKP